MEYIKIKSECLARFKKKGLTAKLKSWETITLSFTTDSIKKMSEVVKNHNNGAKIIKALNTPTGEYVANGKTVNRYLFQRNEFKNEVAFDLKIFKTDRNAHLFDTLQNYDIINAFLTFVFDTEKDKLYINFDFYEKISSSFDRNFDALNYVSISNKPEKQTEKQTEKEQIKEFENSLPSEDNYDLPF